ncbi:MAG: hypothetical protein II306_05660 [Clostridia bacterium]|nr:hypothetical protein [Clostridia bacterium]
MDTFFEQIVVRRKRPLEQATFFLSIFFGALAIFVSLFLTIAVFGLFILVAVGIGVGMWWMISRSYVEYEYSITNSYFDIDRITGKKKRERLISTECSAFEEIGLYTPEVAARFKQRSFDARVTACNIGDEGLYYIIVRHPRLGNTLVIIQPDDRIKSALKKFVPRTVQAGVFE